MVIAFVLYLIVETIINLVKTLRSKSKSQYKRNIDLRPQDIIIMSKMLSDIDDFVTINKLKNIAVVKTIQNNFNKFVVNSIKTNRADLRSSRLTDSLNTMFGTFPVEVSSNLFKSTGLKNIGYTMDTKGLVSWKA